MRNGAMSDSTPALAERFIAWRWGTSPDYGELHRIDTRRPGMTVCGCLTEPTEGLSCHSHIRGVDALLLASGRCQGDDTFYRGMCFRRDEE
jgi:hypothetical protein